MTRLSVRTARALLVLTIPAVIVCSTLVARKPANVLGASDFRRVPSSVPMDPVSLNLALDDALAGTAYVGKWRLNSLPTPDRLTIVVFNSGDPEVQGLRLVSMFRQNAAFIPHLNAITIDYQLVLKLWKRYFESDQSWGSRAALVSWIVGHEVGHLVNGDAGAHFRSPSILRGWAGCTGKPQEVAADEYYAARVASWKDPGSIQSQVQLYAEIVEQEQARFASRSRIARAVDGVAGILNRCTHPEYVIRAYRFVRFVAERTGDESLLSLSRSFGVQFEEK